MFGSHTFNGEDGERVYGVTLAGKAFVNDEHNGSLAVFTSDKANIEVWWFEYLITKEMKD
ncbi:hypothetical protein PVK06_007387 [Gossypium arboreum]|uniref:Uncharacterized protein n=1 Tax=Gossypium arboreum TaxID=29729 RepID=A0ABR0QI71_GOSAR|nr:hypothetical protein PVK06_007387 [Gossypium arboreum]